MSHNARIDPAALAGYATRIARATMGCMPTWRHPTKKQTTKADRKATRKRQRKARRRNRR